MSLSKCYEASQVGHEKTLSEVLRVKQMTMLQTRQASWMTRLLFWRQTWIGYLLFLLTTVCDCGAAGKTSKNAGDGRNATQ